MSYKLLLADDSVTIQKVVELTFSDEDFQIISVGDGAVALDKTRSERPDIILSDVIMPGMNGYELCTRVKQDPALKDIPFLFLKGTFESFDEERAKAVGSDGFIVKPFESQELVGRVKELVERARAAAPAAAATAAPVAAPPLRAAPPAEERPFEEAILGELGQEVPAGTVEGLESFGGPGLAEEPAEEVAEEDLWSEVKISDHPIPTAAPSGGAPRFEEPLLEEIVPEEVQPPAPPAPPVAAAPPREPVPPVTAAPMAAPVAAPPPAAAPAAPEIAVPPGLVEKVLAAKIEEVLRDVAPGIIREVARQVIADVVWEVVPDTAERLVKEEIARLTGGGPR